MTDELVKRLREVDAHEAPTHAEVDMAEAADRLEALTAERDARIDPSVVQDLINAAQPMLAEANVALQEDNARLLKALANAGSYLERGLDKMAFNIIRAALKGGTP